MKTPPAGAAQIAIGQASRTFPPVASRLRLSAWRPGDGGGQLRGMEMAWGSYAIG